METSNELKPERYRSFLIYLARRSLPELGPAAHKVSGSDIVQDVLLRAYEALPQFRGSTREELMAWLRKILENQLYDVARHFGRQKRDAGLEESIRATVSDSVHRIEKLAGKLTSPSRDFERKERALRLAEALETLPEDQKTAVELHHLEEYSVTETAEKMNRTRASVAGLLRRGFGELGEQLGDLRRRGADSRIRLT